MVLSEKLQSCDGVWLPLAYRKGDELIKGMIYQVNCYQGGDCWKHANQFPMWSHAHAYQLYLEYACMHSFVCVIVGSYYNHFV